MNTTNDAFRNPYYLLVSAVRDLCYGGRRALAARLKPELFRRYGITEQQSGFSKFGDFLRAAERGGFIHVSPTPGGDLEVWPTGYNPPTSLPPVSAVSLTPTPAQVAATRPLVPSSHNSSPVRVRPDLWNAFTSFQASWVYDVARDEAYKAPGQISTESQTANLIQIPTGRERTIEWMRAFAEIQDPEVKSSLHAELHRDSAPYHFNSVIRANPRLHRAWRRFHIQQVVAAIDAWAASNKIRPKDVTTPYQRMTFARWTEPFTAAVPVVVPAAIPPVVPPLVESAPIQAVTSGPAAGITPRLASLIDEMIDELLRLRGALQVVEPRR